jgi:hypothetical protein
MIVGVACFGVIDVLTDGADPAFHEVLLLKGIRESIRSVPRSGVSGIVV